MRRLLFVFKVDEIIKVDEISKRFFSFMEKFIIFINNNYDGVTYNMLSSCKMLLNARFN